MKEAAIEVKDLCIDYRGLKTYSIKKNLLHLKRSRAEVFHAVKHVSFTLEKGEILGIIGKNGSMLKKIGTYAIQNLEKMV